MRGKPERVVMYHGTSTSCLPHIVSNGFVPEPPVRLSALMAMNTPGSHTEAFPGTYMTASRSLACSYARNAEKHMGGDGVVVAFSVPISDLIPDEDEVLFALALPLAYALGWDADEPDRELKPWSMELATEVARDLVGHFDVPDLAAEERVAAAISMMVSAVIGPDWDHSPELFDPELNGEWASPNWVKRLTKTAGGMAIYRDGMDRLTRAMAGADPDSYPCELESCKGRIASTIEFGAGAEAFIVAIGSVGDPTLHHDDLNLLSGSELVDGESRPWLSRAAAFAP